MPDTRLSDGHDEDATPARRDPSAADATARPEPSAPDKSGARPDPSGSGGPDPSPEPSAPGGAGARPEPANSDAVAARPGRAGSDAADAKTGRAGSDAADAAPGPLWRVAAFTARRAAPAILLYACVRAVGLALLWWWGRDHGQDLTFLLSGRFDTTMYVQIAESGYDHAIPLKPDGTPGTSNLAFFPLFPILIKVFGAVLPFSPGVVGLLVAWGASLLAAWGIFMVGDHLGGRRVGILLAVLWGVLPHAVVESMAYTESIFTAFAAWSLYAVMTRRWLTAGVLCLVSGLVRPTAAALALAVGVGALIALWQRRESWWRPVLGAALAPLGLLAYVGWVGLRLGRADGYLRVQDAWGSSFDGGEFTVRTMTYVATHRNMSIALYMVTVVLLVGLALLLMAHAQPWPLWVYSLTILLLTAGTDGYYHSKGRLMLPAFTLLLPAAQGLAKARTRSLVVTLLLLTVVGAWFGGYLRLIWHASP